MLKENQRKKLLMIAREAIDSRLKGAEFSMGDISEPELKERRGVFVTIKKRGQLRGCIGLIYPLKPLAEAVKEMAMEAAFGDPRFHPLSDRELKDVTIEISALTVPEKITNPEEITMGRDGVIVRKGDAQGVFLPQVAEETGWSREEFLNNLCKHKAGIPEDSWRNCDTEIHIFQAEAFSENG